MRCARVLALCALGVVVSACQGGGQRDPSSRGMTTSTQDQRPEIRAYLAKLEEWRRDSAVIDSLARLIDIDSALALRRAVLLAGTEMPYRQAIVCEFDRRAFQHGLRPAEFANKRLDSALTPEERTRYQRISSTGAGLYEVSDSVCGPMGVRAPKEVHGVSLFQISFPPLHPDSTSPPRRP